MSGGTSTVLGMALLLTASSWKGVKQIWERNTCMCLEVARDMFFLYEIHADLQLYKILCYANTSTA